MINPDATDLADLHISDFISRLANALHSVVDEMEYSNAQDTTPAIERKIVELPIELYEYIIAFLDSRSDSSTIMKCALVCRAWLPFSRSKLFHIVVLSSARQWTRFETLLSPSASSAIVGYLAMVRELTIWRGSSPVDNGSGGEAWTRQALVACSARLTGLIHVNLYRLDWSAQWHPDHRLMMNRYKSLKVLKLHSCTFSSVVHLHRFVTAFPALSDLDLSCMFIAGIEPDVPFALAQSSESPSHHSLTFLELDGDMTLAQWVADTQMIRNLKHLHWWDEEEEEEEETWAILAGAIDGSSLLSLRCAVPQSWKRTCPF